MEGVANELARLGLDDGKVKEVLKNPNVAQLFAAVGAEAGYPANKATLLQHLALNSRQASPQALKNRPLVAQAIADGRLLSNLQVDAAFKYVGSTSEPTTAMLDKESGVGVVVNEEDVKRETQAYIAAHKDEITQKRYKALGPTMGAIKKLPNLQWASPSLFKPAVDSAFLELLGPKDERDDPKLQNKAAKQAAKQPAAGKAKPSDAEETHNMFEEGFLGALHAPGENEQTDPRLTQEHLSATHGKVFTRFPPEPNGFLHIGHAKAIATNFGYAAYHRGQCYLRFDDTNPEAEDTRFSKAIEDIVAWLGFKPYRVTWSSDYFDELYALAEKLIEAGGAYVCQCTPEEVKRHRGMREDGTPGGERSACVHRSQTPTEALQLFRDMRDGKFAKGKATLRMKQDLDSPNPQMWDLVAYRVLDAPHHRTGTKWRIYPTYDFTHCLVDSIENISHSLCTLEFRLSRESYEWLCDAVRVYKPAQREFGRLNLTGSVMSKRKLLQLVEQGHVRDWDDPRLYTLVALRRRGVPPGAILAFINELGVTTTTSTIETVRIETSIRKYLEHNVPRLMMVLDPIKVRITNLPADYREELVLPFKPGNEEMGEHSVPFTSTVYIDRSDFREASGPNYFRLALDQPVGLLRVAHPIRAVGVKKNAEGKVVEIEAELDKSGSKPKTFIQWVAESPRDKSPVRLAEVREFERLFKSDNPAAHADGYLADLNPNSETVWPNAMVETGFWEVKEKSPWKPKARTKEEEILEGNDTKGAPESVRFQALRVGYYCMDKDSTEDRIVLNRIVTLKEDKSKS